MKWGRKLGFSIPFTTFFEIFFLLPIPIYFVHFLTVRYLLKEDKRRIALFYLIYFASILCLSFAVASLSSLCLFWIWFIFFLGLGFWVTILFGIFIYLKMR